MSKIKNILKKNKVCISLYVNFKMLILYLSVYCRTFWRQVLALFKKDKFEIKRFKNIHHGKRCFIVGSGPSLTLEDIELIKGEYSFTVNHGYNIYNKTGWQADYYVVMEDNDDGIRCLKDALEFNHKGVFCGSDNPNYTRLGNEIKLVGDAKSVFLFDTFWNKYFPRIFKLAEFSKDISKKIYCGKTVVYSCIQIAAYMGFTEIYLLGVDCDYTQKKRYADITDNAGAKEYSKQRYIDTSRMMRVQFEALAKDIDKYSVKVYNASRGGALEAFPRVNLEDVVKGMCNRID